MELVFLSRAPGVQDPLEALAVLASEELRAVEWQLILNFEQETAPTRVDALHAELTRTGVRVSSIHAPFGAQADIAGLDPAVRAETLEKHRACIAIAGQLGARYLVVHPGHCPRSERIAERLELAEASLRELEPLARAAGVILAVENLPPNHPGDSAAELLALVDAVDSPNVGVCFDIGHANVCGDMEGMARALLPRTVTMHIHDNDGSSDQHLLPGRGQIDWPTFTRIYRETGCTAPAMLEVKLTDDWNWRENVAAARQVLS